MTSLPGEVGSAPQLYTRSMPESNSEATRLERDSSVIGSRARRGGIEVWRQGVVGCREREISTISVQYEAVVLTMYARGRQSA
jgi:hypothetical protein